MTTAYVELESGTVLQTEDPRLWPESKKLTQKEGKRRLKEESLKRLHEILKPGDTVLTVLRHVSSSGMSRRIDLFTVKDNDIIFLSGYAAHVLDIKLSPKGGLVTGGCGMDMGFHLVYNLGLAMWLKGTPEPHGRRNGAPDSDGGYALKHRWM